MKSFTAISLVALSPLVAAIPTPQVEARSFSLASLRDFVLRRQSYGSVSASISVSAQISAGGKGSPYEPHHVPPPPGLPHFRHTSVTYKSGIPFPTHNASHAITSTSSSTDLESTVTRLTTLSLETTNTYTVVESIPYPTGVNGTTAAGTAVSTDPPAFATGLSSPHATTTTSFMNASTIIASTGTTVPISLTSAPYAVSNTTSPTSLAGTGVFSPGVVMTTGSASPPYSSMAAPYPLLNSTTSAPFGTARPSSGFLYTNPFTSTSPSSSAPYPMGNSSSIALATGTGMSAMTLTTGVSSSSASSSSAPYPMRNLTSSAGPSGTGFASGALTTGSSPKSSTSSTAPYPLSNSTLSAGPTAAGTGTVPVYSSSTSSSAPYAMLNFTASAATVTKSGTGIILTVTGASSTLSYAAPYPTSNATSSLGPTGTGISSHILSTGVASVSSQTTSVLYSTTYSSPISTTTTSSFVSSSISTTESAVSSPSTSTSVTSTSIGSSTSTTAVSSITSSSSSMSIPTSEIATFTSELPSMLSSIIAHESTTTITTPSGPTIVVTSHTGASLDIDGSTLTDVSISGFDSESASASADVGAIASIIDSDLSNVSISGFSSQAGKRDLEKRATTCASGVYIIIARGSTEAQGAGAMGAVASSVVAQIPGSTIAPVVYPASLTDYAASEASGDATAVSMIKSYVDACPDGDIVLMGYSQGAAVVGDALCGDSEATAALGGTDTAALASPYSDAVKAVILMGDPAHVPGQSWDVGTSTKDGISPRQTTCTAFTGITQSYCDTSDEFCDSGTSLIAHLDYITKYGAAAVKFVVDTMGGSSTTTSSGAATTATGAAVAASSSASGSLLGGLLGQLRFRVEERKHSREMK